MEDTPGCLVGTKLEPCGVTCTIPLLSLFLRYGTLLCNLPLIYSNCTFVFLVSLVLCSQSLARLFSTRLTRLRLVWNDV